VRPSLSLIITSWCATASVVTLLASRGVYKRLSSGCRHSQHQSADFSQRGVGSRFSNRRTDGQLLPRHIWIQRLERLRYRAVAQLLCSKAEWNRKQNKMRWNKKSGFPVISRKARNPLVKVGTKLLLLLLLLSRLVHRCCPPVRLSVCRQNAKKRYFLKN